MPSFDIVSKIDTQEVRNAVENVTRDLSTPRDFHHVTARFEFDEKQKSIKVTSESTF